MNTALLFSRIMLFWILFVIIQICILLKYIDSEQKSYYTFGPNDNLFVVGLKVNTNAKYACIVIYCIINSAMRALRADVLAPWLIHNVQNNEPKDETAMAITKYSAYETTTINTVYIWFDYFLCLNIFLSQIDLMLYEVASDIIISNITAYCYLKSSFRKFVKQQAKQPLTKGHISNYKKKSKQIRMKYKRYQRKLQTKQQIQLNNA